jgi:hypothetical protein
MSDAPDTNVKNACYFVKVLLFLSRLFVRPRESFYASQTDSLALCRVGMRSLTATTEKESKYLELNKKKQPVPSWRKHEAWQARNAQATNKPFKI